MPESKIITTGTTSQLAVSTHQRVSNAFPAGQGDLALVSIDDTIFWVHRSILQHSSSVFETIFENNTKSESETDSDANHNLPPLRIETDAATLELLLAFAYPNKPSPSLTDVNSAASVFRAAKRYEMDGVHEQLRKALLEVRVVHDTIIDPLYVQAPLAVLVISYAFDCIDQARFALRECMKGNLKDHLAGAAGFDIPADLILSVIKSRDERFKWFMTRMERIQWRMDCANCPRKSGEWQVQTINRLNESLDFGNFKQSFDSIGNCASNHPLLTADAKNVIYTWQTEWNELTRSLPPLPRLSH